MGEGDSGSQLKPTEQPASDRLEGWKEIAAHLKREVRTVQRWEKSEGLPIHRHQHDKLGTVWAFKSEIEAWLRERQPQQDEVEPQAKDLEPYVEETIQPPPPRPRIRWPRAVLVSLVLALAAYGAWILIHRAHGSRTKVMLAVLPFENLSGDKAQEYFSDGLTDETIAQLGGLDPERLGVIARTSAMTYKNTKKDARQIGHELGVQYLLEGTVLRDGERLRITAQLIQCSDQTHLWANSYERDLRDILALQSDVARAVSDEIRIKLTTGQKARLAGARPVNPEAYEAYLRGRFSWNKRYETVEALKKSIDYYQEAIQKDPNFALAYAGLADSYSMLSTNGYDVLPPQQAMPEAERAAAKARDLNDTLAETHNSLAWVRLVYDWDLAGAESEFKRAIELNSNYATAHQWYAWELTALGRLDQAVAEAHRAQELDPLSIVIYSHVGWELYMARRYDEAITQCRKTLELAPGDWLARYSLGRAYEEKGMYADAVSEFEKGTALPGGRLIMLMGLGHAYAVSGNKDEAQKILAELERLSSRRYVPALYLAALYTGLGEKNQAFDWLEKAFKERSDYLICLKTEPIADPLRSDPRFKEVLRRIGLAP